MTKFFYLVLLLFMGCMSFPLNSPTLTTGQPTFNRTVYIYSEAGGELKNLSSLSILPTEHTIELHYYYTPKCPFCRATSPYILDVSRRYGLIGSTLFFDLSLNDTAIPTNTFLATLRLCHLEPTIPLAVLIIPQGDHKVIVPFQGADEVPELESWLTQATGKQVGPSNHTVTIPVTDCMICHEELELAPPSTYVCTGCCHGGVTDDGRMGKMKKNEIEVKRE